MMNRFVVRSLMRDLIGGCEHSRRGISTMREHQSVGALGGFYWTRTMSSVGPGPTTANVAEKKEKGGESKKSDETAVVSSYWGVLRPKIKRDDGTDWPWNCFMVTDSIIYLSLLHFWLS
jgi:ubiquinol oxidase